MPEPFKDDLHGYLHSARSAALWKLDGLSEYDSRRPLTPTGTNVLGLVKHLACVEMYYFGVIFGSPAHDVPAWFDENGEPSNEMWATAEESRAEIVAAYQRAWAHTDATISALSLTDSAPLDWVDGGHATLHFVLVHMLAEVNRHLGHVDIVRELVDGSAGYQEADDQLSLGADPSVRRDRQWWQDRHARIEHAARAASDGQAGT